MNRPREGKFLSNEQMQTLRNLFFDRNIKDRNLESLFRKAVEIAGSKEKLIDWLSKNGIAADAILKGNIGLLKYLGDNYPEYIHNERGLISAAMVQTTPKAAIYLLSIKKYKPETVYEMIEHYIPTYSADLRKLLKNIDPAYIDKLSMIANQRGDLEMINLLNMK